MYRRYGKRAFDLMVAVPGLVVLSPLMAAITVMVRIRLGRPCLFRQQRGGLHGKPFNVLKFRTMSDARDSIGTLLPDYDRLDPFGRILRATSLDELPELFNVVRGEMSLVGPRPFLYDYMPFYSESQRRRHDVRPGITGDAQVNGRNWLSWDERFERDLNYIDRMSFRGDALIIAKTVLALVRRHGINESAGSTSGRFDAIVPAQQSRTQNADDRRTWD